MSIHDDFRRLVLLAAFGACGGPAGGNPDCSATDSCPNTPPTVQMLAPTAGLDVALGVPVTFQATSSDVEDGSLTGSSLVWRSDLDGSFGTGGSLTKNDLSVGTHVIQVTATDSRGATATDERSITVTRDEAPTAEILSPMEADTIHVDTVVPTLIGTGNDPEDGVLSGSSLEWVSDIDGPLGFGDTLIVQLAVGDHEIILFARDSRGAMGSDTVHITVIDTQAPVVTITAPTNQPNGAPHTVLVGSEVILQATAIDPQDGPLPEDQIRWRSTVDFNLGRGSSVSVTLSEGMHTIRATGTDSEGRQTVAVVLVIVKPTPVFGMQLEVRISEGPGLTSAQTVALSAAKARIQGLMVSGVPDFGLLTTAAGTCGGASIPPLNETVDDLIVYVDFSTLDGPGGVLATGGWCIARIGSYLPLVGGVHVDIDDVEAVEDADLLESLLIHELIHVLGFTDGTFELLGLLEQPANPNNPNHNSTATDAHFTGPFAIAEFAAIGGGAYTGGQIVPLENNSETFPSSLDSHWRESVLDSEMMTPALDFPSNPLSALTINALKDLGYAATDVGADSFDPVFSIVVPGVEEGRSFSLRDDVPVEPRFVVEPGGRPRRVR